MSAPPRVIYATLEDIENTGMEMPDSGTAYILKSEYDALQVTVDRMKRYISATPEIDALWKATVKAEQLEQSWKNCSEHCNRVADQRDALRAKLTEAEARLQEIYATEPVAVVVDDFNRWVKVRMLKPLCSGISLIPLPTPKEPT